MTDDALLTMPAEPPAAAPQPAPEMVPNRDQAPWLNASRSVEERVEDVLSELTVDEKLRFLCGRPAGRGVLVGGVSRLGLPPLRFGDPTVRPEAAGPAPLALAATWDVELAGEYGRALGEECRAQGITVFLGPAVDIARVYQAGHVAGSFGEDPYLSARMAAPLVRGVQSRHVLAAARHFVLHNQQTDRLHLSVQVGDRALHEIYLPPFEALVRAGVGAVMVAGNKVSGTYASEHAGLLVDELRTRMGFAGFAVSDWEGTHSLAAVACGLSVELPQARYFGEPLRTALAARRLDQAVVDEHVRRILRSMFAAGLVDARTPQVSLVGDGPVDRNRPAGPSWRSLTRRVAEQGIVLLRNERQILPLDRTGLRRVAVVGATACDPRVAHGGAGRQAPQPVDAASDRTVLAGLRDALGTQVEVVFVPAQPVPFLDERPTLDALVLTPPPHADAAEAGLLAEYFDNTDLAGRPVVTRVEDTACAHWAADGPDPALPERYSARWTALLSVPATGRYTLGVEGFGTAALYLDGALLAEVAGGGTAPGVDAGEVLLEHGRAYLLRVEYRHAHAGVGGLRVLWEPPSWVRHPDVERAAAVAAECDAAVVVVGVFPPEGVDRPSLALPGAQDALVEAVAAANPRTVVVLASGGPVLLPWIEHVPAVVQAWYGGPHAGDAVAGVLTGAVNPSGRLPVSFPRTAKETPTADRRRFPGVNGEVHYTEDLLVGYRWYDATGVAPLFPFGHGLSYTDFSLADLRVDGGPVTPDQAVDVSVTVTNTGARTGVEVVQLYVGPAHALDGPPRQLRGFRRVQLAPGETRRVTFTLRYRDFCRWSSQARDWLAEEGEYRILVGRSSADLPLRATVAVRAGAGPCAVTLDTPAQVNLGSAFTVSAAVQNLGPRPVAGVAVALDVPSGWNAEVTSAPPASIAGGATATATWLARPPARARTGPALLRLVTRYDADEQHRVETTAQVTTAYPQLSAAFNNVGIYHGDTAADFCGTGAAYLGSALARAGLVAGRTVTCGQLVFTWPRVKPGQPDNVIASGQRIHVARTGKMLALLGAASGGTATGVGTVTYVDGTTYPYAVIMADWLANQPLPGCQIVATVEQYRSGELPARRAVSVYAVAVPLLPGKPVSAVTLPVPAGADGPPAARLHVFGLSIC